MTFICRLIDRIGFLLVLGVSRVLNVATKGSGREDFSKRAYRKAMFDGGRWVSAMRAVDWFFARLPAWSGFKSDHHCMDVYDRVTLEARAHLIEAALIEEMRRHES